MRLQKSPSADFEIAPLTLPGNLCLLHHEERSSAGDGVRQLESGRKISALPPRAVVIDEVRFGRLVTHLRLNHLPFFRENDRGRDLGAALRVKEFLLKVRGRGMGILTGHRNFDGQFKFVCNSSQGRHLESEGEAASENPQL